MKKTALLASLALISSAYGYEAQITKGQMTPDLAKMIEKANADTGLSFEDADFLKIEERVLATSRYQLYTQTNSMIPVAQTAIRMWSDLKTGELILAEMHLDEKTKKEGASLKAKFQRAKFSSGALKSKQLAKAIQQVVAEEVALHQTDNKILGLKSQDQWVNGDLVRKVEVRGRRGIHSISISLLKNKVVEKRYMEFPQSERVVTSLKANIFPMYEEVESSGQKLAYEVRELKYIETEIHDAGENPLGSMATTKFPEGRYHPMLAETELGEMYGIWSEASIRRKIEAMVGQLPLRSNDFSSGLLLQGRYATINLHPDVKAKFPGVNFPLKASMNHILSWSAGSEGYEALPRAGFMGKTISSQDDLLSRIPVRLPDHDATTYINSGADEAQVYYAVTTLMESLTGMGFTDPELSVKPFHAFLYDPDISMKDNAYYTDNTINFTTYASDHPNLARDNSTIWHELGHGVMERLMGAHLVFADTKASYGGLSEGMADFVAKLVVEEQTAGADFPGKDEFRIVNNTGFYLTNELHDEGEAYGGAMADMLAQAVSLYGRDGVRAFTDLTLETMRLTRNHPMLTPRSWFQHMIYADELGSSLRSPGQFSALIKEALKERNFAFETSFKPAVMKLTFDNTELTNTSEGSREKPLTPCDASGFVSYELKLALTSGDAEFIKFPAVVKVEYKKGALQGGIKWEGEEANPTVLAINSENEVLSIPLKASMKCDEVNQPDGSCKDYAYVQIFNQGGTKPIAKKRFYLKLNNGASCQ